MQAHRQMIDNKTSELRKELHRQKAQGPVASPSRNAAGSATLDSSSRVGRNHPRMSASISQSKNANYSSDPFRHRARSVLPPIGSLKNESTFERRKSSAQYANSPAPTNATGRLLKLDQLDIQSETRSIYKLDPHETLQPGAGSSNLLAARSNHVSGNLDRAFAGLDVLDRA